MKAEEKKIAIRLRKEGKVFREILEQVDVSKGTLSLWLRDVPLSKKHLKRIKNLKDLAREKASITIKNNWKEKYKKVYDKYSPPFKDSFFMLGLGLYMGEGDKYSRCRVGLANSDYKILQIYKEWIERFFAEDSMIWKCHVATHNKEGNKETELWWSKKLKLHIRLFNKTVIGVSRASKRKRNTLKRGTFFLIAGGKDAWKIACKIKKSMDQAPVV